MLETLITTQFLILLASALVDVLLVLLLVKAYQIMTAFDQISAAFAPLLTSVPELTAAANSLSDGVKSVEGLLGSHVADPVAVADLIARVTAASEAVGAVTAQLNATATELAASVAAASTPAQ